jgi:hypothetical protein
VIATAPGKGVAMQAAQASAKVEAVDKATRAVTPSSPTARTRTITAGPEVRNFDQIKVGDTLTIKYLERSPSSSRRTARRSSAAAT